MFNYKILQPNDELFPPLMKEMKKCPQKLYVAGELKVADYKGVAVVGARLMTSYGEAVIKSIVGELVNCGVTIISGLAFGVDIEAQKLALEMGGRTIGVLSGGLNQIVPRANFEVAERIIKSGQGALVSKYEPNQQSERWSFPERDYLMAAFSECVLVIEAGEKSGTSYTVDAALDLGREVFVVPGSIFSDLSIGCHKYLRDGAHLVTSAQDIFDEMGDKLVVKVKHGGLSNTSIINNNFSDLEKLVLNLIDDYGIEIEKVCEKVKSSIREILPILTILELKGVVIIENGRVYMPRNKK